MSLVHDIDKIILKNTSVSPRLSRLRHVSRLRDAVQYDLFPSADMVLSMKKEYGAEPWEENLSSDMEVDKPGVPSRMKRHAPLDAHNRKYMKQLQHQDCKDFVQDNMRKVKEESEQLKKAETAAALWKEPSGARPVHNYSIQTFNSKELTKELLRKEMAKFPGRRFTYSQQYHGATVATGSMTSGETSDSTAASPVWSTSITTDESKMHPKHPDRARVEELRKPWRENILHANVLKPTLSRDMRPSSEHHQDFNIYSKPPDFFSPSPITIHLAGELLRREQLEAAAERSGRWLKKLLSGGTVKPPGDGAFPEFKCHMGGNCERIQDILKDEPKKYSLRKPGMMLKPLPHLSVLNLGEEEAEKQKGVALAPGDCPNCSLGSKNVIPRHASMYNKHRYPFTKQRSLLYKRTALPLTDEEKNIFAFQKHGIGMSGITPGRRRPPPLTSWS
ncbi:uncharacterized protein [Antennarius striatus]|uniref:uncharacterized protein n=1 Tax=Antennarius striatus TaxID=241820 RepID=UPI0035B1D8DD